VSDCKVGLSGKGFRTDSINLKNTNIINVAYILGQIIKTMDYEYKGFTRKPLYLDSMLTL